MLVCFWSPKGGSGTSVIAAAAALVLARETDARIIDLSGDQPAVLGLAHDPVPGSARLDARRPGRADRRARASRGRRRAPARPAPRRRRARRAGRCPKPARRSRSRSMPTRGPACATSAGSTIPRCVRSPRSPGIGIVVVRGCYLGLRRAVRHPAITEAIGAILIDEHGRSLGAHDVEDVLGLPVLATIPARTSIARAVDAGVLADPPARQPRSAAASRAAPASVASTTSRPHEPRRCGSRRCAIPRCGTRCTGACSTRRSIRRCSSGPSCAPGSRGCCARRRRCSRRRPPTSCSTSWSTTSAGSARSNRCSPIRRSPRSW